MMNTEAEHQDKAKHIIQCQRIQQAGRHHNEHDREVHAGQQRFTIAFKQTEQLSGLFFYKKTSHPKFKDTLTRKEKQ